MSIYTKIFASTHDKNIEATTAKVVQGHVQPIQCSISMASKFWRLDFVSNTFNNITIIISILNWYIEYCKYHLGP